MKQLLFLVLILPAICGYAQQDTIMPSNKVYTMKLKKTSGAQLDAYLKNMDDSVLVYSGWPSKLGTAVSSSDHKVPYTEIESVFIKRKGAAGRGALIGAATGFFTGFIIGLAGGDDPEDVWFHMTAGEKGIALGLTGAVAGTLIGAVFGALSGNKFHIQSRKSNFLDLQAFLAGKTKKVNVNY